MVHLPITKWRPLQMVPLPLLLQHKEGGPLQKRDQIFSSFQRRIFALILGGEIDGALTPTPLTFTHTPPCPLLIIPLLPCTPLGLYVHVHLSAHHICTSQTLWCPFTTLHFTLSLYIVFLILIYKFPRCMCIVPLGFSQRSRKSS